MVAFIDEHRDEYGVEPICEVLPIAPSTYFEQAARRRNPELRPARAKRDERLKVERRRRSTREAGAGPEHRVLQEPADGGERRRGDALLTRRKAAAGRGIPPGARVA